MFLYQKTPAEQLRENKRMIDRSIRELDRERMKFEAQEKENCSWNEEASQSRAESKK